MTEEKRRMPGTESQAQSGVQSIERALDIIEAVAAEESGLNLTEISKRTQLHKSTAYRIIETLTGRGYLAKTQEGNYRIGLKLIEAVSYYINSLELQTEARPYVAKLSARFGLTSHLGVLDGEYVVYVEKMDVFSSVRMYSQIGLRMHAYCSSLGKCLLAGCSKQELSDAMKDCSFIRFTPNTIANMDELKAELAKVRKQGWAMDDEEYEIGNRCIAAPIYDYCGDIVAAISVSGSTHLIPNERIEEIAEVVKETALEISHGLGYTG